MVVAACDICELFCDGSRMEYLAELEIGAGSFVTVAPHNRAFLDNRVITVRAECYGLNAQDAKVKRIMLVCEECSRIISPLVPAGPDGVEG